MATKQDSSKHKWLLMQYTAQGFTPYADYDREVIGDRFNVGDVVHVQFKQPRSQPRHRLYWVIVRLVLQNTEFFATEKALHRTLLMACGVVEPLLTLDGDILMVPSSTAFEAMGEDEFKQYFDKAMTQIQTKLMPGVDLSLLLKEGRRLARIPKQEAA